MTGRRDQNSLILVGAITGAVGLKGEVRIASFTAIPEAIADLGPLQAEDGRVFEILSMHPQAKGFAARLKGIATREAAERLRGVALHVPRTALPETEEGEYYLSDLIGLSAVLKTGEALGEIVAVENFGAGDLLEVRLADERRTVYVPFTRGIVPLVDLNARQIVIDPPDGLLDDAAKEQPEEGEEP